MKTNIPNIRILRKEIWIAPSFMWGGFTKKTDVLQYKDDGEWKDIPVESEYNAVYGDDRKNNNRTLGNENW